jgi:hypothetical protein
MLQQPRNREQALSDKEAQLLRLVRSLQHGEVTVVVKGGQIDYFRKSETVKP